MLTAAPDCYTPPQLARRWRCKPESVIALIRSGKLRGFTLSPAGSLRPRWKITPDAVAEYEHRHTAKAPEKIQRQTRRPPDVVEYY